jgi:hypothetical protein
VPGEKGDQIFHAVFLSIAASPPQIPRWKPDGNQNRRVGANVTAIGLVPFLLQKWMTTAGLAVLFFYHAIVASS